MRLIYSGSSGCSGNTFSRLLLLAERIAFMDRPSVTFGNWGTVGAPSPIRAYEKAFEDKPMKVKVFEPPSGPAGELYLRYLEADISDLKFRETVMAGLASSPSFQSKLLSLDGKYHGAITGHDVLSGLLADRDRLVQEVIEDTKEPELMFNIDSQQSRDRTFNVLLTEASINLTSTMFVAEQVDCIPVSDDQYTTRLLAMRCTNDTYLGSKPVLASALAFEVLRSVIPEQLLGQMSFGQIIEYRDASKDAYKAWLTEMDSLATKLSAVDMKDIHSAIQDLYHSEVAPKILSYKKEMESIRDKMFAEMLKKVLEWRFPALLLSQIAGIGLNDALIAFAASLGPAVPAIVDNIVAKRDLSRKNSYSFLIGLAEEAGNSI